MVAEACHNLWSDELHIQVELALLAVQMEMFAKGAVARSDYAMGAFVVAVLEMLLAARSVETLHTDC